MKIAFFPFFASWTVHHAADRDLIASLIAMNHECALLKCSIANNSNYCIQRRDFEKLPLEHKNGICNNCQKEFNLLFTDLEPEVKIYDLRCKFKSIDEFSRSLNELKSPYRHIGNHIARNSYFYIEPSLITHYEISSSKLLLKVRLVAIEGHLLEISSIIRSGP